MILTVQKRGEKFAVKTSQCEGRLPDFFFFRFWSQVDPILLPKLNMPWAYKNDFEMFDYSMDQYLENYNIKL